jgi:hypothetical protein
MIPTLNEMITAAINSAEEDDSAVSAEVQQEKQAEQKEMDSGILEDAEKVAQVCEFIGRRGVESFLKTAAAPETNEGQSHAETKKKQVGPHGGAPPMKPPGAGSIPTNADQKPGGGKEVDTAGKQLGDHHPALASNQAAIDFTKKEKAKLVSPSLKAVLDTTPFADPKLKEMLDNSETDKNIHSKAAHDEAALRAELQRRMLLKQGVGDA